MIKVFTVNGNGKIEFTKEELEKLLNDAYAEGQKNCNCGNTITWTNPYLNQTLPYQDEKITNITSTSTNENDACECANPTRKPYTVTATFNAADAKEMSKRFDDIIKNVTAKIDNDAFSKLAKELTF